MQNESNTLHETVVRDVFDVIKDMKDIDQVEWIRRGNDVGSIARRSSNLILVFPVLTSTSISIGTATMIQKAIERKCVALLQILFSSIQFCEDAENIQQYIRKFHRNLNTGTTFDDMMTVLDNLIKDESAIITDTDAYNMVKEDMKNINYVLSTDLNPIGINEYKYISDSRGHRSIFCEAKDNKQSSVFVKTVKSLFNGNNDGVNNNTNKYYSGKKYSNNDKPRKEWVTKDDFNKGIDDIKKSINASNSADTTTTDRNFSQSKDIAAVQKNYSDFFKNQITSTEINKANELMPTTMIVNFITVKDGVKIIQNGVIGVKAKLYPVDSMDIIDRISDKYNSSNTLFNLIKATTREISFFRDFLFAIDNAKLDAIKISKDSNSARLFRLLERRSVKNKYAQLLKKNDASPITSLIMSQEEVEYLLKYFNLDMNKTAVAAKILESYNLMDIVIADEGLELAKFLYDDGSNMYEILPFDALQKEAKDNSYKKVVNLLNKMR